MTIISKELFYKNKRFICTDVHDWNSSCLKALLIAQKNAVIGTSQFYLPIYLLQAAMSIRKDNVKTMPIKLFLGYMRSLAFGLVFSTLFIGSLCVSSNMLDGIFFYTTAATGLIAGASILIESPFYRNMNTIIIMNLVLEAFFNNIIYFNIVKLTRFRETILFMNVSAMVIYLFKYRKEKNKFVHFWFYQPQEKNIKDLKESHNTDINSNKKNQKLCSHEENCYKFAIDGFKKYFLMGFSVNLIKTILPKFLKIVASPKVLANGIFNKENVKLGLFFASYAAIYRYMTCYLLNQYKKERKIDIIASAFVAGITYAIKPNIQILSIGITTILQILVYKLIQKNSLWSKIPLCVPYMFGNGLLAHNYFLAIDTCPKYYKNCLIASSNGLTQRIYSNALAKMLL